MKNAYIGLGSNLGNRFGNLAKALAWMAALPGVRVEKISSLYWTSPVGTRPQPPFLNGVVRIKTSLHPEQLLRCLQHIEARLGRVRYGRNRPRTVDLDILALGNYRLRKPGLTLPHPRMDARRFVLQPLADLSMRWRGAVASKEISKQIVVKARDLHLTLPK